MYIRTVRNYALKPDLSDYSRIMRISRTTRLLKAALIAIFDSEVISFQFDKRHGKPDHITDPD